MNPGTEFEREILEQPAVLLRLFDQGRASAERAAFAVRAFDPTWVLIAARGSSDNAARYAQYLFGAHNRLGVALAGPSLFTLYDAPPNLSRALTIGISQSGQSPDIVGVLSEARAQGGSTLALTNDLESPLARSAEHSLPLLAGPEKAIAASKTYTAELFLLAMLSAALSGNAERWAELARVPGWVTSALTHTADLRQQVAAFVGAERLFVLGRGFNYGTAFEIALKLKETSYILAEPYSVADLLHGPVAIIDRGFPVLLVAPSGRTLAGAEALLPMLEARGARILAISDAPALLSSVASHIELPTGVPEWLSPLVAIVAGQRFAAALAVAGGEDPDFPRGLTKVTLTH